MSVHKRRKLLLLGAGFEQITAIEIAQELGYSVTAFDNQKAPVGAAAADEFVSVNVKDDAALIEAARKIHPDGVFVHAAELAIPTAKVADALGLPGIGTEVARRCTDKRLRTAALAEAGIETPAFRILEKSAPLDAWIEAYVALGPMVVCKPPDMAGARGVELVQTADDVASYRGRGGGVDADAFLMETYTSGGQLSTESVIIDGVVAHTAIALRHYDTTAALRPYLIEDGHSMGLDLSAALTAEIDAVTARAAAALGMKNGVLKGDLIIPGDGRIVVLEMAGRTSGGRFADTVVPRATGVNILYPLIQMAMGDTPDRAYLKPRWKVGMSQRFFFPPPGETIAAIPDLSLTGQRPGVVGLWLNRHLVTGAVLPEVRCHGDRLGYVLCTGVTREAADALALDITRNMRFDFAS